MLALRLHPIFFGLILRHDVLLSFHASLKALSLSALIFVALKCILFLSLKALDLLNPLIRSRLCSIDRTLPLCVRLVCREEISPSSITCISNNHPFLELLA
jgi:hypothetical protein